MPDGSCQDGRFDIAAPPTDLTGSKRAAGQEIVRGDDVGWRRTPNRGTGSRVTVRSRRISNWDTLSCRNSSLVIR